MLLAVCQTFDINVDHDLLSRIAFGFAGGIGNSGAVCGAVIGGVMAIGLKRGQTKTTEEALQELDVPGQFRRRFEAEMGTIHCRELTGMDLSTAAGLQQFMGSDKPQTACFPAVSHAYRIVVALLTEG